jgi:hypothetical protein
MWDYSSEVEAFDWVLLAKHVTWEEVLESMNVVKRISGKANIIDGDLLFSQTMCVKRYVTQEKINCWKEDEKHAGVKWTELFQKFSAEQIGFDQILKIVQFALALPGTNAPVERVFSIMNDMWTGDKSQMKAETVKSMLQVRINMGMTCIEFHTKIKGNSKLLESIHSSSKYKYNLKINKPAAAAANAPASTATDVASNSNI